MEEVELVKGTVFCNNGVYSFVSNKGDIYSIKQDDLAKRLAFSNELCILQDSNNLDMYGNTSGKIVDILGKIGDPLSEGMAIARVNGFDKPFTNSALRGARSISTEVTPEQITGILDSRKENFVTIDPDRAKDFDDAVLCKKLDDGYELKVAIANVSEYVKGGTALFNEAFTRGVSKYLGNTVYPMLPEELSNGICSLNEGVDRLVMLTTIHIKQNGEIASYSIGPSVINSKHRLTYKQADYIHFGHCDAVENQDVFAGLAAKTIDVKPSIDALFEVSEILAKQRHRRGAISVEPFNPVFVLNNEGTRVDTVEEEHKEESTRVIESTAILVNEIFGTVAKNIGMNTIYRNHILPEEQQLQFLREKLSGAFAIVLPSDPTAEDYRHVLNSVKGKPIEEIVTSMVLRAFREAYYAETNEGHFGLGIKEEGFLEYFMRKNESDFERTRDNARNKYMEETGSILGFSFDRDIEHNAYNYSSSPIRDFCSLAIQNQLSSIINYDKECFTLEQLNMFAQYTNSNANIADRAEKEYNQMLATVWAKENIGNTISGRIVNFYPDGVSIKTCEPKNITITIPYSGLTEEHFMCDSMVDAMLSKYGNRLKPKTNNLGKAKRAQRNCPLDIGMVLDVVISGTTVNPFRIIAEEEKELELEQNAM